MQRINTSNREQDKFGSGRDGFRNGDPTTGTAATSLTADWFDHMQEEVARIVENLGIELNGDDYEQLYKSIRRLAGTQVTSLDADTTLGRAEAGLVLVDASDGNVTLTLPPSDTLPGMRYILRRTDGSGNSVTIAPDSSGQTSDTVDGGSSLSLSAGVPIFLVADGASGWTRIGALELVTSISAGSPSDSKPPSAKAVRDYLGGALSGKAGQIVAVKTNETGLEFTGLPKAVPPGTVSYFAADDPPDGWLVRDGAEISRSEYSDLFDAIGTAFGSGDGYTTFELPDDRGEFIRGWDDGRGVDSGRSFGSSQLDQMQRITGHTRVRFSGNSVAVGAFSASNTSATGQQGGSQTEAQINFDSADSPNARTSSSTDGETRPRNRAYLPIIKY